MTSMKGVFLFWGIGPIYSLSDLGPRIVILGPSNSGKSTLALAIGRKNTMPVVFLDQLRFEPKSDWVLRDVAEFEEMHKAAIDQERWVIEGNYSSQLPERLGRATGVIVLHMPAWLCLVRYLSRTIWRSSERVGGIGNTKDRVTWDMLKWVVREGRTAYANSEIVHKSALPVVLCANMRHIRALYSNWDLMRP